MGTETEKSIESLRTIVDRLGPNMWLHLDDVSFPWFFNGPLRQGSDAVAAAKVFAYKIGGAFIFDPKSGEAKFGRAYFNKEI